MKKLTFIMAFLFAVSGCATHGPSTKTSLFGELGGKKGYSWLHDEATNHKTQAGDPAIRKQVQMAVESELAGKGYVKVPNGEADVLITWFGKKDEKVKVQEIDHFYRSYGYGALAAQMPMKVKEGGVKTSYLEGTLVVDVIDANSKDLLWRGTGTQGFPKGTTDEELKVHIRQVVKAIMKNLPQQ